MQIGFIGLGAMGQAMADNLVAAGFDVTVWNRTAERCDALVKAGARRADTPTDCGACDVLVTMLADDEALTAVVDDYGLIEAMGTATVHVNMATISVACARRMADRHAAAGKTYLAAPVLGRPDLARAAKLNVVAAGAHEAIGTAQPALDAMAVKTWPAGDLPWRANVIKLATNAMLVAAVESMAEAAAMTDGYGVEPADFLEIITNSVFAAPAYQGYAPAITKREYTNPEGFKLALGAKDMDLALTAARAQYVAMPMAAVVRERLSEALAAGHGELDLAVLAENARRETDNDQGA